MSDLRSRLSQSAGLLLAAVFALAAAAAPARAQDIEERVRALAEDNARLYSHPVSSGLAAGLSSGWFSSARPMDVLGIELSIRATGSLVPDEAAGFQPVLPESQTFTVDGQTRTFDQPYGSAEGVVTPTAAGDGTGVVVGPEGEFRQFLVSNGENPDDYNIVFPDGFDIPATPLAALQGSVGLPVGTEATLRLIPSIELHSDVGSVSSFGFGLKHSVSQWFPGEFPLDVAVEGGIQSFDVGDYISASSTHFSLLASRDVGLVTLYGSGGVESSDVDVNYTYEPENPDLPGAGTQVEFSDEGDNSSRLTLGFNLDLLFLRLNAGYTISDYDVLDAGVGVTF